MSIEAISFNSARRFAFRPEPCFPTGDARVTSPSWPALSFEQVILPHMDAAFRLARWLTRDSVVAEDIVQDACLRALRYFKSFRGENGRAWLMQIVRNTAQAKRLRHIFDSLSELDRNGEAQTLDIPSLEAGPEATISADQVRAQMREAVAALPDNLRQVLYLREIEELPYQEIAQIVGVPIGTVMSRLFRARRMLMTEQMAALR